jgi:subtilase family serine protease
LYLAWSDLAGAQALAAAVSDPKSPSYGHYLTPQAFRQRFAPSQQAVAQVTSWLQSQGFSVTYVPQNNHYVAAEGTVANAAAAFQTSFGMYAVDGRTLRAPTSDPSVPPSLAGVVSAVVGLDQTSSLVRTNVAKDPSATPAGAYVSPQPCSAFWGEKTTNLPNPYGPEPLPYAPCGYTPSQIRSAYGVPSGGDGSGQTVVVIDAYASPTIQADLDAWSAARGMRSTKITQVSAPGTYKHPEANGKQDPQGWYGEQTLDIEAVHGMAPGANIVYVAPANAHQDMDAALNHVVDRGLGQIVSNSYGFNGEQIAKGFVTPLEHTLIQAAIEGIGVYFSSGDDSDESLTTGVASADWPASSPWVTAVGGTSLAVGGRANYLFETGWGTARSRWDDTQWSPAAPGDWLYGAGGGVSTLFAEPAWQAGVVDGVLARYGRSGRAVPDVGAFADPNTGYLVGQTQAFPDGTVKYSEYRIGGTSLSCPIFAGMMAVADQAKGAAHGFVNPVLYGLPASVFNDVVSPASPVADVRTDYNDTVTAASGVAYTLRTMNQTLSLKTTPGYDDVTGRGTPTAALFAALSK